MTIRKSLLVLTLAASSLYTSQAGAFFSRADDRPPPNGMYGVSLNGMADQKFATDRAVSGSAAPKAVVLSDGSRVVVK
jgi:hypothetical protein